MESGNFQPRLISKNVISDITDYSTLFDENSEYQLKIETFTLAHGKDFVETFGLMLASFYVFNVRYPRKLEGSLLFFQKFMLGIGDETKTPQKVLQFISKVKKAGI